MKTIVIYEVALTGVGHNFFTLYRHVSGERSFISTFIQNLSINFDEAVDKARYICGPDEESETYSKRLVCDPDEVNKIKRLGTTKAQAELEGILTFGKHKGERIEDVFVNDHKYVEWIAKGGNVKSDEGYWYPTIEEDRPVRHQAIALLIGAGEWIERQGKFMPVDRAQKLDYIDSLTINTNLKDGVRVKGILVRLLSKPFLVDNEYGGKWIYKLVDENNNIYHASSTNLDGDIIHNSDVDSTWYQVDFTPSLYQGKMYVKRVKFVQVPVFNIREYLIRIETQMHNNESLSGKQKEQLEYIGELLDSRYGEVIQKATI